MFELLLALIPLALAAALQPPQVIALIFLLQTSRGLANGLAYIGGMTAFRLAIGMLFWVLLTGVEQAVESAGSPFSIVVGAVLAVLGILLLVYALRRGLSARDEDDAAARLARQDAVGVACAVGAGRRRFLGAGSQGLAGQAGGGRLDRGG